MKHPSPILQFLTTHTKLLLGLTVVLLILIIVVYNMLNRLPEEPSPQEPEPLPITPTQQQDEEQIPAQQQKPTEPLTKEGLLPITPNQNPTYLETIEQIQKEEAPSLDRKSKVGSLINELPHTEETFILEYSFDTFDFVLTLDQNTKKQGFEDFRVYLQSQGIDQVSWLTNMKIVYTDLEEE